ncbi:hypothetical protein IHE45_19G099700 [Dioscorea alata]|uniref:Uncharacterized protein n=1 Tax=Dioscorea alata TaxID=55571 RepID=A0ACB7U091_DIOAL|nr:hypothetical protein IHE45_19G099700 [Dioscorea alata]
MASTYLDFGEEKDLLHHHHHHHHHHQQQQGQSPKEMKRTWSTNSSSSCDHGAPKCVCAPATHAGSFKCRLHRTNSHSRSATSGASLPPPPAVSTTSTRTVEAV